MANGAGKRGHLVIWNGKDSSFEVKSSGLLLGIGNAWRQGSQVPVYVSIALLTTERENVEPFCRNHLPERFGHPINELLKLKVLLEAKVASGLFPVRSWSDQRVAIEHRVFV